MASEITQCACCSGRPYFACCQPYHDGLAAAPTAEALMRSRYCAYALGIVEYIIATTHPDHKDAKTPRAAWKKQIYAFCGNTTFQRLQVLSTKESEGEGYVTFTAHLLQNGSNATFTERSRFLKSSGRWAYVDGEIQTKRVIS